MHEFVDGEERKRCGRCRALLTLERFSKSSTAWDGLQGTCRDCQGGRGPASPGVRRSEHQLIDGIDHKRCGRCHTLKPTEDFNRRTASRDGLSAKCRPCDRLSSTEWFHANRDQHYANTRRWIEGHPEERAVIQKRWNDANPDYYRQWREDNADRKRANDAAWYAANREHAAAYSRAWRAANPEACREHSRRYAARRRSRILELPHERWTEQQIIERDGLTCWICGIEVGGRLPHGSRDWHVDHLIPLAADYPDHPGDTLANLAIACARCNYDKNAKLLPAAIERFETNLVIIA